MWKHPGHFLTLSSLTLKISYFDFNLFFSLLHEIAKSRKKKSEASILFTDVSQVLKTGGFTYL